MRFLNIIERMQSFDRPWFICGGWAIDLFIGRATRPHHDVDIGVFREDQLAFREHLSEWVFEVAPGDGTLRRWEDGEFLESPLHCLWGCRTDGIAGQLELLLSERRDDTWFYRREPSVELPVSQAILHVPTFQDRDRLVPILAPEIVLLFKAKRPKQKDNHDLNVVLSSLSDEQILWLGDAIELAHHECDWWRMLRDRVEYNKLITDEMLLVTK